MNFSNSTIVFSFSAQNRLSAEFIKVIHRLKVRIDFCEGELPWTRVNNKFPFNPLRNRSFSFEGLIPLIVDGKFPINLGAIHQKSNDLKNCHKNEIALPPLFEKKMFNANFSQWENVRENAYGMTKFQNGDGLMRR